MASYKNATWVKPVGTLLPHAYTPALPPKVGELDELETLDGSKFSNIL
jgi:hypothetical protein